MNTLGAQLMEAFREQMEMCHSLMELENTNTELHWTPAGTSQLLSENLLSFQHDVWTSKLTRRSYSSIR